MYSFNKIASLLAFAILFLGFSTEIKAQDALDANPTKVIVNIEGVVQVLTFPNCGEEDAPKRLVINGFPCEFAGEIVTVDNKLGFGTRIILEQGDCEQSLTIR